MSDIGRFSPRVSLSSRFAGEFLGADRGGFGRVRGPLQAVFSTNPLFADSPLGSPAPTHLQRLDLDETCNVSPWSESKNQQSRAA